MPARPCLPPTLLLASAAHSCRVACASVSTWCCSSALLSAPSPIEPLGRLAVEQDIEPSQHIALAEQPAKRVGLECRAFRRSGGGRLRLGRRHEHGQKCHVAAPGAAPEPAEAKLKVQTAPLEPGAQQAWAEPRHAALPSRTSGAGGGGNGRWRRCWSWRGEGGRGRRDHGRRAGTAPMSPPSVCPSATIAGVRERV
eukprot:543460-Prymnesium_polylepis.1